MAFVVLDQRQRLLAGGAGQLKSHVDALEDGCVAAVADRLEVDIDTLERDPGIASPTLNQQHATR